MAIALVDGSGLTQLVGKGRAVVADFYADWCAPCRAIAPEVEALASSHPDIEFVKVDVDRDPDLARQLGIVSIPTVVHFSATGEEVARSVGALRAPELARQLALE